MSRPLKEHEGVRITKAMETAYIGSKDENIILPAGSGGAVIYVWGDATNPTAYQIEFHLEETDEFAVANVPAEFVEPE